MNPFLPPWCLSGCSNGPFLPPWCLPVQGNPVLRAALQRPVCATGSQPWSPPQDLPRTGPIAIEVVLQVCSKTGARSAILCDEPPWCLPGGANTVQLILSCLPGVSQAVQMVRSYLPGASQVPRWLSDGSCPASLVPLGLSKWSFPASLVPPCQGRRASLVPRLFPASLVSPWCLAGCRSFPASLVPPRLSNSVLSCLPGAS